MNLKENDTVTLQITHKKVPRNTLGTIIKAYEATSTWDCYDVDFGEPYGIQFILGNWLLKKG